jgi:glyoxylase-like metal-dependent hydrolase (beta-lactamase superfamily II)
MWRCLVVFALMVLCSCSSRVRGPHGIVGGRAADGFFYVVPVAGGVVLIDTGEQPDGALLRELVAGRTIVAVLVTHAHHDHYAFAHALGSVPVYVGAEDIRRMRGETQHQGAIQRAQRAQNGGVDNLPPVPAGVRPVADQQRLVLGDRAFTAIALPGHTPGSTAYLYEDVLFGGDAAMARNGALAPIDEGYSDDPPMARASLRRLTGYAFRTVMDGHTGITAMGPDAIARE